MLLEVVGILSLRNYSWSIGFHIVVLGTHGVLRLFYFVMENACLRQLEFWACANINHLNTSVSVFCDRCKKWQNYCKKIFLARQIKFQNFNGKLGLEVFFFLLIYLFAIICVCASQCTKNWRNGSVRIECASVKLKISTTHWRHNAFCVIILLLLLLGKWWKLCLWSVLCTV